MCRFLNTAHAWPQIPNMFVCLSVCAYAWPQIPNVQQLAHRLSHVRLTNVEHVLLCPDIAHAPNEIQLLRTGLALLRALPGRPGGLTLHEWRASEQVITELGTLATMQDRLAELQTIDFLLHSPTHPAPGESQSDLSDSGSEPSESEMSDSESSDSEMSETDHGKSEIELEEGEIRKGDVSDGGALEEGELHAWELEPLAQLPALVQSLPADTWSIGFADLSALSIEAFVCSAPRNRTAARPLTIVVHEVDDAWVADMNAKLERTGPYPHVTVEGTGHTSDTDEDW